MISTYKPKHIEIVGFSKFDNDYLYSNEQNLIYDANGNLVTGDGFYREYNELNQLIRIRNSSSSGVILEEFVWHPVEERILIKDIFKNGVKDTSIFYVNENFIRIENSTGNYTEKYIYQDGILVAQVNTDGHKRLRLLIHDLSMQKKRCIFSSSIISHISILQNSNFQTVREAMTRIANYFDNELSFKNWCS